MDHVITYVSTSLPVPWWVVIQIGIATIALFIAAFKLDIAADKNGTANHWCFGGFIVGLFAFVGLSLFNTSASSNQQSQRHPSVDTIAKKFDLTYIEGSSSSYGDAQGHRYNDCYVVTNPIDDHHVSSKLLCTTGGKSVVVHKAN